MRFRRFSTIVFIFAATFVLRAQFVAQSFHVPGDTGTKWIDTHLDLKPGTLIRLAAKGEVTIHTGGESYGPEGTQKFPDVPGYPAETIYRYGLVARVTQSSTNPEDDLREQWAYGETQEHCAASGGHLWLTVNDNEPKDNQGEFVVDVSFGPCRAESTTVSEFHPRFRVTINGFTVDRQTNEQENERRLGQVGQFLRRTDGAGDEVFIRADVFVLEGRPNGGFEIVSTRSVTSRVMGDTSGFAKREQAGTASRAGGLRSGDNYPTNTPWLRNGKPRPDELPMIVWEGEFRDSAPPMSVIIIPTIWEWDEPGAGEFAQAWDQRLYPSMLDIFTRYGARFDARDIGPEYRAFDLNRWFNDLPVANVPIGRMLKQVVNGRLLDRFEFSFNTAALDLTSRTAPAAARKSFRGAAGVIEIPYIEYSEMSSEELAHYTLYAQIERVN